jgi:hypothetical protein
LHLPTLGFDQQLSRPMHIEYMHTVKPTETKRTLARALAVFICSYAVKLFERFGMALDVVANDKPIREIASSYAEKGCRAVKRLIGLIAVPLLAHQGKILSNVSHGHPIDGGRHNTPIAHAGFFAGLKRL